MPEALVDLSVELVATPSQIGGRWIFQGMGRLTLDDPRVRSGSVFVCTTRSGLCFVSIFAMCAPLHMYSGVLRSDSNLVAIYTRLYSVAQPPCRGRRRSIHT